MTEDTDRGLPIYWRACPVCEAFTVSYYPAGGVAVMDTPGGRTVVIVGIPLEACRTPGCGWAGVPHFAMELVLALAQKPGDAVREYMPGRLRG